ncbi:bifunctional isocitrate dehydrogenase kinase/phosphatase [Kerstersia similis]|uniref:bifunctional isocitrate dehydrogenase kinase/phosphatase n=1 Tax=Kerstersia similis TaxID=206505 RepID=UPI0039F06244
MSSNRHMPFPVSDAPLRVEPIARLLPARQAAASILQGFNRHYALFRYSAQRAKALFEAGDWRGMQQLSRERIDYYDQRVRECAHTLAQRLDGQGSDADPSPHWQAIKQEFVALLDGHPQPECAETFFNSVSCRVLRREYFNNACLFVRPAVATDYLEGQRPAFRAYYPTRTGLRATFRRMLGDFGLAAPFEDLPRDVRLLARAATRLLRQALPKGQGPRLGQDCQVHVHGTLFFRNKGAYLLGRLVNQGAIYPFCIPLLRLPSGQLYADALLHGQDALSRVFSFARTYFLVDMEAPSATVRFLSTLLPRKPLAELYTMIGLQKQGKTLFYRDFLQHLAQSGDAFETAAGIPGMVMFVFTLPSYPYVFKIIRDHIEKDGMTASIVRRKYQQVKLHDRAGRMADTWEYSQVALPRHRFSDELLQALRTHIPSQLEEQGDTLILRHVYIERRMTPLNLYLWQAGAAARAAALEEYGNAIRELAATNLFPGDMLFKNFGVTRLGRVVFYDYDEIQSMTEMNFRHIPDAPDDDAEMSADTWYATGPNDVFPEEFEHFLFSDPALRLPFVARHAALLQPEWWRACQARIARGGVADIFPYDPGSRFASHAAPAADELAQQR